MFNRSVGFDMRNWEKPDFPDQPVIRTVITTSTNSTIEYTVCCESAEDGEFNLK